VKFIKKIVSWALKFLAVVVSCIILYLIIALILTFIPENSSFKESKKGTAIYVSSNGVHIDLILPSKCKFCGWTHQLDENNSYNYLAFGWGDRDFYMNTPAWSDLKIATALKAAFIPTRTVIQVYGLKKTPSISKNTRKINLSDKQLEVLSNYIYHTFQLNDEEKVVELFPEIVESGFYKYYKAKGNYSLLFTCNNWVNRGLKKAGVKNAVWAPFDKSVLYHLN
jgi:uncharacterized protein (TIGR02117 family)